MEVILILVLFKHNDLLNSDFCKSAEDHGII